MKEKNRDDVIDIAKGIGILCVILLHIKGPWCGFIGAWVMPLFFSISGFFVKECTGRALLKSKVKRLLYPFVFYYIYEIIMKILRLLITKNLTLNDFSIFNNNSVYYNLGPIWFLIALFYIFMIDWVLSKFTYIFKYIIIIGLFIIPFICIGENPLLFNSAFLCLPFFISGLFWKNYFYNKLKNYKITIKLGSIITFALIICLYSQPANPIDVNKVGLYYNPFIFLLIGWCGLIVILLLSDIIEHTDCLRFLADVLKKCGLLSLHIMSIHFPFLMIFFNILTYISIRFSETNLHEIWIFHFFIFLIVAEISYLLAKVIETKVFLKIKFLK